MKLYTDDELAVILDKPIFHQIGRVADELGVECYVVGGYVRDIFLERPSNDIDVVVVGSGIEVARRLKDQQSVRTGIRSPQNPEIVTAGVPGRLFCVWKAGRTASFS